MLQVPAQLLDALAVKRRRAFWIVVVKVRVGDEMDSDAFKLFKVTRLNGGALVVALFYP